MKDFSSCLCKLSFLCVLLGLCAGASAQCKFTTLNIPGAVAITATGINDQGAIVGAFTTSTTGNRGFCCSRENSRTSDFLGRQTLRP